MKNLHLIKTLYQTAFAADERRHFDDLEALADTPNEMNVKIEELDGELLSFIIYWEFNDFIYIEHFAVNDKFRNKKHGTEIFRKFMQHASKPVILEVEPPENAVACKRIQFYERLGMILYHFPYTQPPYDANKKPVNMLIMGSKNISENTFEQIKSVIFEKVYSIKYKKNVQQNNHHSSCKSSTC